MVYRQDSRFLRYGGYPLSSYVYGFDPNNDPQGRRTHRFCPPHNHMAVEMIYVTEGCVAVTLNGERSVVEKGEIAVFSPLDIHLITSLSETEPVSMQVVNFDLTLLRNGAEPSYDGFISVIEQGRIRLLSYAEKDHPITGKIIGIMNEIHEAFCQTGAAGFMRAVSALYSLMATVYEHGAYETASESRTGNALFARRVVRYVSENYATPLSTKQMADELHIDRSYFCRLFRSVFDQTFVDYLHQYRISVAKNLDLDRYRTLGEIAREVGYPNYDMFAMNFKRYIGITPKSYYCGERPANLL